MNLEIKMNLQSVCCILNLIGLIIITIFIFKNHKSIDTIKNTTVPSFIKDIGMLIQTSNGYGREISQLQKNLSDTITLNRDYQVKVNLIKNCDKPGFPPCLGTDGSVVTNGNINMNFLGNAINN